MFIFKSIIALASLTNLAHGFVQPTAFAATTKYSTSSLLTGLDALPSQQIDALHNQFLSLTSSLSLADDAFEMDPGNSIISGLSSAATFVGGVVLFFVVVSVLVATFIIPAAAKELEENVRKNYPDLWQECSAKLEPGEDLSMRPDLIQEMGNKYQSLQLEEFNRAAKASEQQATSTSSPVDVVSKPSQSSIGGNNNSDAIDVEVTND